MIRILTALLAAMFICHPIPAQSPDHILASFVDKSRVLLLFAPTDHDPHFQEQLTLFSHHSEDLKQRDLILLPILSQTGAPVTPDTLRTLHPPLISDSEQLVLRHRFGVQPTDFAAILLGKDGGEKLRSSTPISIQRLNRTVDAMPMRRQEMRERAQKQDADAPPTPYPHRP